MSSPEFQFNFKFNLHKSVIPIGIADDDYERLSVVYGVPLEDILEEANAHAATNAEEAAWLAERFPNAVEALANKRIVFMGDSITDDRQSYVNIYKRLLKDAGTEIMNDAISAYKLVDIITNFVPRVTDFKPQLVHIMVGSNDMKRTSDAAEAQMVTSAEYERQLSYLVWRLKLENARVILTTVPPFDPRKVHDSFFEANIVYRPEDREAYNAAIRRVARMQDCVLNDMEAIYSEYSTDEITRDDGLHLNRLGQRLLATRVLKLLIENA